MKTTLFFLSVFFITFSGNCTSSLTIYLSKCRSECDTETGVVRVFKENKLLKKSKKFKTEIDNLTAGIYGIEYSSIADKRRYVEIEIRENEKKVLTLCFDDFDYHKKNAPSMVDVLPIGDQLTIYQKTGKFKHKSLDSLQVQRTLEGYFLQYNSTHRKMTDVEVEIIREFEYFMRFSGRKGWKGSKEKFTLQANTTKINCTMRTGKWNGFYYLLVDLKLKDKESCK